MRDLFESVEPVVVVGVSELIEQLQDTLDEHFGELWVEGEIGSLHHSRLGHLYFDLKDEQGQLRCAMFRSRALDLRFELCEGMLARVRSRLELYPQRGSLQLIVEEVQPAGEGALRLAFERMKQRMLEEGLFDPARKRALPRWPERIGLVTSIQGAALHDFVRALRSRGVAAELLVYDARVQGEGAWRGVVRGLHLLDVDPSVSVIVLARGGGSLQDLWTFNQEEVVRAIFELSTPVVSAIGHEVDQVLTDLVADVRAATPTAAAELVVPDGSDLLRRLVELERRLLQHQRAQLVHLGQRLEILRRGLVHPAQRLAELGRQLGEARARLTGAVDRGLLRRVAALARACEGLTRAARQGRQRGASRLDALAGRLDALSPLGVLERGYALARRVSDGAILRSSEQAPAGTAIDLRLARGALRATVTRTEDE